MPSVYPAALDSFDTTRQDGIGEVINADEINELADAVNKIEAELGTAPSAAFATVDARFTDAESRITVVESTGGGGGASGSFAFFMGG